MSGLPGTTMADNYKAECIWRGRLLVRLRDRFILIRDEIEDEGDRVYFGSTNDADAFREIVEELDSFSWDMIMREKGERNVIAEQRHIIDRLRAEVLALPALVKALEEAREWVDEVPEGYAGFYGLISKARVLARIDAALAASKEAGA